MEICTAQNDEIIKIQTKKLLEKAVIHSGNIPSAPAYWRITYFEFQAANFYWSYIEDKDVNMFGTVRYAEYHEFNLQHLLSNYIKQLSPPPSGLDHMTILTDNSQFNTSVPRYKNIVTHYLASEMEIWMAFFLRPVYGIESDSLSFEFAKK